MNAEQFRTRLAEVLVGVPDHLHKPIQQFCGELRQEQQTLKERLTHSQSALGAEKQDRLRLANEAAASRQQAAALQQALSNAKLTADRLGRVVSTQDDKIAELQRCPDLAIPESVNLRCLHYPLLEKIANGREREIARRNDDSLAGIRRLIVGVGKFYELPKFKRWGEQLTREQLIFCHALGFSEAAFLETLCSRSPKDFTLRPFKLLADD